MGFLGWIMMGMMVLGSFFGFTHHTKKTSENAININTEKKQVALQAEVFAHRFNTAEGEDTGYHLLVWQGDKTWKKALFRTSVDRKSFYHALAAIGGIPGNNLSIESWKKRNDPSSQAPDAKVEGSPVQIEVIWDETMRPWQLTELFHTGALREFNMRFAGNLTAKTSRHTGCLVCLYSCSVGVVGNAALSIRDFVTRTQIPKVKENLLPPDGTRVTLIFYLMTNE